MAAMERVNSGWAKELLIAAHTAEPETLARRAAAQSRAGVDANAGTVELTILDLP